MADNEEMSEEDRMAAEWEAMTDDDKSSDDTSAGEPAAGDNSGDNSGDEQADDEQDASTQSDRALNQDEIDSLLGFVGDVDGDGDAVGVQAIVNSELVSYERLPMLEVVYDRLVRMMSTSLRNLTSDLLAHFDTAPVHRRTGWSCSQRTKHKL